MEGLKIRREWAMPDSNTFDIKPIRTLIYSYHNPSLLSIDPFANTNRIAKVTNDIDPAMRTQYCMDAIDFLKMFKEKEVDLLYFDPPYSPRQVSECYKRMGFTVDMETTQASFWGNLKNEVARIMKPDGIVISFGWSSNGIGLTRGFKQIEILLVAHGGNHNDTICVVEKKEKTLFDL